MLMNSISGLEMRGQTYYLRVRVPKGYADVEPKPEINRSLKTRDLHNGRREARPTRA